MIQHYGPRLTIALSAITFAIGLNAQNFVMAQPLISSCSGVLYDSGGTLGVGYSNNENFTTTICGDQPGRAVGLTFNTFDLDQSGTDDALAIYDGNSINAPLIGTYYGTDALGQTVTATANNPSGCLTLVFTSSASGTGVFSAGISCSTICVPPVASFTNTAGDTARICQGDFISVNGSASASAPGHSIVQWIWGLGGNGQDTATIPFAIHQFLVEGVHRMTLEVVDETGCSSGPSGTVPVLVSAIPDLTGTLVPETACEGAVFQLNAHAVQPLMLGDPVACTAPNNSVPLVDSPVPSTSTLIVSGQSGGLITDIAQLGDICLEMEHSYMGDLVVSVTCPTGQSVVLHQQGGGGTFLGDANDFDGDLIVPGTCFQYCFGASPEFSTLANSTTGGLTPNEIPVTQGSAIASGRYASVQPLEQLLGCPFNGTWTFSSSDQFGSDNGYLCGWCISFGASTDSSFVDQGPILGSSADSSFWSGPSVVNTAGQPGQATFTPQPGEQEISYTVIDSYGCEYVTEYAVSVGTSPEVTIENNPELGLVCAQVVGGPVTYQWSYAGQPVVGAAGTCFTPPGTGLVSVFVSNAQGCSDSASLIGTGLNDDGIGTDGSSLTVLPVPNNGTFTVLLTGLDATQAALRVSDMTGRTIHHKALSNVRGNLNLPMDLDLAPGAYFVELMGTERRLVQRIVVR